MTDSLHTVFYCALGAALVAVIVAALIGSARMPRRTDAAAPSTPIAAD
ncbi:MAG TPA: hypothetical protein VNT75_12625 [Symbiobacteriaceae bacterium]|nr:hypothetical protein [Symbiobacteriaceae bacterium]